MSNELSEKSKQPEKDRLILPEIDGADKAIAGICVSRAREIYSESFPGKVKERLDAELDLIIKNGYSGIFLIAQKLVRKANDDGYTAGLRSGAGAALVSYLLGITEFDPLDYNIPFECFFGLEGERTPVFDLSFSEDYTEAACKYLQELLGKDSVIKLDAAGLKSLTMLKKLEDLTGADAKNIPLDDEETLTRFINADTLDIPLFESDCIRSMIKTAKPKSFDDFIKIFAASRGADVWDDNAENLIISETAALSEIIAARDEIMTYLTDIGVSREQACGIMNNVRRGLGLTREHEDIMTNAGVPDWYIESCKKIKFLSPKADSVGDMMISFRIAWFKAHYPEAFYKVYEALKQVLKKELEERL
jgi:DNA polymerase III alpha subunit (gram-positive type)